MLILLPTKKQYYLLIQHWQLYRGARKQHFRASYYPIKWINHSLILQSKMYDKPILLLVYDKSSPRSQDIRPTNNTITYNLYGMKLKNNTEINTIDKAVVNLSAIIEEIVDLMSSRIVGMIKTTDYKGRCGNCHQELREKDKFCRFCGTRRGDGKFKPFLNSMYAVYGPPVKTKLKCNACEFSWESECLGSDRSKYCPQCGSEKIVQVSKEYLDCI